MSQRLESELYQVKQINKKGLSELGSYLTMMNKKVDMLQEGYNKIVSEMTQYFQERRGVLTPVLCLLYYFLI